MPCEMVDPAVPPELPHLCIYPRVARAALFPGEKTLMRLPVTVIDHEIFELIAGLVVLIRQVPVDISTHTVPSYPLEIRRGGLHTVEEIAESNLPEQ